ncbi:shiftless antiviral inhibitor of ribosomal frameshifting protein homolog [Amphiura filiformis]|uniref:shiftless antiviral inhibitor of ribosomal frameshifting protein homolog n=1 Tax=Amphiura filiformis TaxID=82378 RepID=UPI003B217630
MTVSRTSLTLTDQQEKVSSVRELFHGRFSEDGIAELLEYFNWNVVRATTSLIKLRPEQNVECEDLHLKAILERLKNCQTGSPDDVWQLVRRGKIDTEHRQFACGDCDYVWWRRVPARKLVSKCRRCKEKYDPIPREYEWGWATFHCICGNTFSGFGQMNKTESRCFKCSAVVTPSEVKPPDKRGQRKSRRQHQCNAPDCHHGHGAVNNGVWNQQCAHPKSRRGKEVLMPSVRHVSTGSTVDTFLPQTGGSTEPVFSPSLGNISEQDEDEDGGRNSGDNHD